MTQYRHADFLSELRRGRYHGVFIDDTGSPGLPTGSTHLHPERKSFVAVVISAADIGEVLREMPGAIEELTLACGAAEFHFADIYNGRRQFKHVELNLRLAFFRFMSHMFQVYKFPIIVQTFDSGALQDVHRRANLPVKRIGPFNLQKQEDLALFFLYCGSSGTLRKSMWMEAKHGSSWMKDLRKTGWPSGCRASRDNLRTGSSVSRAQTRYCPSSSQTSRRSLLTAIKSYSPSRSSAN